MDEKKNYFTELYSMDVGDKIEKKNGLNYISWAWAWAEIKKRYPNSTYTIYEDANGRFYHTDGKTCWVKTGVTVNEIEHIEYLPVMDLRNKSIPVEAVTSFDVNKTIQRSLTKACARHGIGLYVYAGEDLPEDTTDPKEYKCCDCGKQFEAFTTKTGKSYTAGQLFHMAESSNTDGKARCKACAEKAGTRKEK